MVEERYEVKPIDNYTENIFYILPKSWKGMNYYTLVFTDLRFFMINQSIFMTIVGPTEFVRIVEAMELVGGYERMKMARDTFSKWPIYEIDRISEFRLMKEGIKRINIKKGWTDSALALEYLVSGTNDTYELRFRFPNKFHNETVLRLGDYVV